MFASLLDLCAFCFLAHAVCFQCTEHANNPLTVICCVFQGVVYGKCLERKTGLCGKREGFQCCILWVQYFSAACRAVLQPLVSDEIIKL